MSNERCRPAAAPAIGEGWHVAAVRWTTSGNTPAQRGGHILENRSTRGTWYEPHRTGRQVLGFSGSVCDSRSAAVKVPNSQTRRTQYEDLHHTGATGHPGRSTHRVHRCSRHGFHVRAATRRSRPGSHTATRARQHPGATPGPGVPPRPGRRHTELRVPAFTDHWAGRVDIVHAAGHVVQRPAASSSLPTSSAPTLKRSTPRYASRGRTPGTRAPSGRSWSPPRRSHRARLPGSNCRWLEPEWGRREETPSRERRSFNG